jgi:sugar transferase (PEP-CTERM/EpsH1 system associated)
MNVLFVVPYVPNLIRVRPYNLIRSLGARGNRVTVLTIWANEAERASLQQLQGTGQQVQAVHLPGWRSLLNCLAALPTRAPLQSVYSWDPRLAGQLQQLAAGADGDAAFDVVHVEHLRGVRYALALRSGLASRGRRLPVVWDSVDSISLLFRQAMVRSKSPLSRGITRLELGRTEAFEGWLVSQFDRLLVTSPADRKAFLSLARAGTDPAAITVLRNGVDLDYFRPDPGVHRQPATIVISGKMSYHANVTMALHFVQDIMPLVWARRPDTQVCIVGKDPPKSIQDLTQNPKISVTGMVRDIRPYLQSATLAVAPIAYGVGIQNKVLEALACGTPVVATPQAVSALEAAPGRDLLVAEGPAAFADAVLCSLADPDLRREIGQAGRTYVEKNHDWQVVAGQLEEIYAEAIQNGKTR